MKTTLNSERKVNIELIESGSLQLVRKEAKSERTIVNVKDIQIGGSNIVIMAGPCSVESEDQILKTAHIVKKCGANILRGGAFKPRKSPYSFRGLKEEGLKLLALARRETGLPIVTEVMDTRDVELVCKYADILQIGSRNMQCFSLLDEVGLTDKPVLLKRGMSATIEEFLYAAEYILKQGNKKVILCERGIRTFETSTRNTLDLNAVPMLNMLTHLPVIVDPSHGTGHWWMVPTMAKAAIVANADGLLVEVHHDPQKALSDGPQSLGPDDFRVLMKELEQVTQAVGKKLA
jgi:3-deoxy-7-phosphoheptulonate synthase